MTSALEDSNSLFAGHEKAHRCGSEKTLKRSLDQMLLGFATLPHECTGTRETRPETEGKGQSWSSWWAKHELTQTLPHNTALCVSSSSNNACAVSSWLWGANKDQPHEQFSSRCLILFGFFQLSHGSVNRKTRKWCGPHHTTMRVQFVNITLWHLNRRACR